MAVKVANKKPDDLCRLFALCENEALFLYDCGVLGEIAGCERCCEKMEKLKAK